MSADEQNKNAFERWLDKGNPVTKNIKLAATSCAALSLVTAIVLGSINEYKAEADDTINALKENDIVLFDSHQDCVNQGYDILACYDSQINAINLKDKFTTPVEAMDFHQCAEIFGSCPERISQFTRGFNLDLYKYRPIASSWVAVKDDISIAAPLYKLAQKDPKVDQYIRIDGVFMAHYK
ncbi:MAG: hypothetical protein VYC19_02875 [Pseudomonadota bacterium]|nr:hypothetical protein [Pseudomonadota bacterium]MEC7701676.1 hypothetical protein [Pseudomonadota bacterium]MEC9234933.1 hypothetical protein [Pseudomonadota bacterium]